MKNNNNKIEIIGKLANTMGIDSEILIELNDGEMIDLSDILEESPIFKDEHWPKIKITIEKLV